MMSSASWADIFRSGKGLLTGFLLGVGVTYLLLALGDPVLYTSAHLSTTLWNGIDRQPDNQDSSHRHSLSAGTGKNQFISETEHAFSQVHEVPEPGSCEESDSNKKGTLIASREKQLSMLLALWEASTLLALRSYDDPLVKAAGLLPSCAPRAPHLEDCDVHVKTNQRLDARGENKTWPPWISWKRQLLGLSFGTDISEDQEEYILGNRRCTVRGPYPPWVQGADEDNLPMTRRVQRDIWLHQHPQNCHDPDLRFLLTDWESNPGFGMGAQFAAMAGMLAIAVNERRILITNYFNRANHEGCVGSTRSHWSCYFFLETSEECRDRALVLASQPKAWEQGLITGKNNYTSKQIWIGKVPECWGKPWEQMESTTEIDGKMLVNYRAKDRRWWRAQAVRYLMRFPSNYTCTLLNLARHQAFGAKAAIMVLETLPHEWPKVGWISNKTEIDRFVWDMHKPWVPRPLLSIHVRQGDKAREMKVFDFQVYMNLAQQTRNRFPNARNIWLSTEMQDVIDASKSYIGWDFYFTNISRQVGNVSMPAYEASLGRQVSTNYPLVNFLMAVDADFFIGALGSTWCYLIDGMRSTSGKVMAGYLSVNKYRFW